MNERELDTDLPDECPMLMEPVELTSKKLKLHQIYAVLLMIAGFIIGLMGLVGDPVVGFVGIAAFIAALIWLVVIQAQIWWHHK